MTIASSDLSAGDLVATFSPGWGYARVTDIDPTAGVIRTVSADGTRGYQPLAEALKAVVSDNDRMGITDVADALGVQPRIVLHWLRALHDTPPADHTSPSGGLYWATTDGWMDWLDRRGGTEWLTANGWA